MGIRPIFATVSQAKEGIENLSIEALKGQMAERDDLLLVDVRELQEYIDLGAIPGARHAPRGMLEFWADPSSPYYRDYFKPEAQIVLYCAAGGRSALAAKALLDMGYPNVAHLAVGFNGWAKAGEAVQETGSASRWQRKPKAAPADERPALWIGHALLRVPDPAASRAFFVALGARDAYPDSEVPIMELRGGTHLVLRQGDEPPAEDRPAPFDLMVDDIDAAHTACQGKGLGPEPLEKGEVHRFFRIREPGGHVLTIYSTHVTGLPV